VTATVNPSAAAAQANTLSAGAKAGIGVGVALGVPLFTTIGIGIFLILRRIRAVERANIGPTDISANRVGESKYAGAVQHEMDADVNVSPDFRNNELDGTSLSHVGDAFGRRHELEDSGSNRNSNV
jgi:hypothetical protein